MTSAGLQEEDGAVSRPDGAHGTGLRFMPLTTCGKDSSPAVICIAGAYPGLRAEQLADAYRLTSMADGTLY